LTRTLVADTCGEHVESNCPFCDRRQFEERLIAEVDGFYIIATLGQITDGGYVLLFPKEHVSCEGDYSEKQIHKANVALTCIEEFLFKEYKPASLTRFEHGIVGQTVKHAHLHVLPVGLDLMPRIKKDFPMSPLDSFADVKKTLFELYQEKKSPYLSWGIEDETGEGVKDWVCWNPPAPPQYLRIITAEALGRPERANWRTMDADLDRQLWSETVRRLKPYFT
jgi:diadenosine tetraphosphate (Ap4A) HIT family hydrolase